MTERFDVHAIRHRLKLKRDTGHSSLFENRDSVACPVCDEPFAEVFTTERREQQFRPTGSKRFCLLRDDDRISMFTHE